MARYLTLSRAARLAGVKRGALQQRISQGDLPTFEGKIELSDLLRVYPQARLDDTAELERVDRIKMKAVPRTMRGHGETPDLETLRARATKLGAELARAQADATGYRELVAELQRRLGRAAGEPGVDAIAQWLADALAEQDRKASIPDEILIKDTMLRFLSAHVFVYPSQHDYFVEGNDTILEAGLRAGLALPYGCSDASCGRCRARLLAGKVRSVREARAEQTHDNILLCCHTAISDVEIEVPEARAADAIEPAILSAEVCKINRPQDDMVVLDLKSPRSQRLRFLAGQYARLSVAEGAAQHYAIASCPCDERQLQFHICREDSAFSRYVFERLSLSDTIDVQGPFGRFVLDEESPRSLIFLAWNSGFAPIKSLIENAMALDAAEHVHLYWCFDRSEGQPYMHNLCRSWHDALDNFVYTPLPVDSDAPDEALDDTLNELIEQQPDLNSFDVFVAGPEAVVANVRGFLRARGFPADQLKLQILPPG